MLHLFLFYMSFGKIASCYDSLVSFFAYMCKYMHHVASVFILAHSVSPFILLIFLVEATALFSFSPNISLK